MMERPVGGASDWTHAAKTWTNSAPTLQTVVFSRSNSYWPQRRRHITSQPYSRDIILVPCIPSCGCVYASGTRGNCKPSLVILQGTSKRNAFLSSSLAFLFSSFPRPNLPLFPSHKMHSVVLTGLSCYLRTSGSPVGLKGPGVEKVQHPFLQYQKFCFL